MVKKRHKQKAVKRKGALPKAVKFGRYTEKLIPKKSEQKASFRYEEKEEVRKGLRIALFSWESLYSIIVGAMSIWVTELAHALQQRGHEVHLFTRRSEGQSRDEQIDGVYYHRCDYDPSFDFVGEMLSMCRSFVSRFFEIQNSRGLFDIIHGHDWLTANAISWINRDQGIKTIITIYSTEYRRCGNEFRGGESRRIREYERDGTCSADQVITISQRLKQELAWLYDMPDRKISVVYNGVHSNRFKDLINPDEVRARYGIGVLDPTALFVGEMAPQYGPDIIIYALSNILSKYPAAKFIFIGEGEFRKHIQNEAHRLGVSHATRFLAHVEKEEFVSIFKSCDVILVPSRNEFSYGIVLEAWNSGRPVIVTDNGPSEFVWHEVTGLKIHDNPSSLAGGIERIFSNHEFGQWMGRNGRIAVETGFSWDMVASQVEKVYLS